MSDTPLNEWSGRLAESKPRTAREYVEHCRAVGVHPQQSEVELAEAREEIERLNAELSERESMLDSLTDAVCSCGGEINGNHDHATCGPPIPRWRVLDAGQLRSHQARVAAELSLKAARWDEALRRINGNGVRASEERILVAFSILRVPTEGLTLDEIVTKGVDASIAERAASEARNQGEETTNQ